MYQVFIMCNVTAIRRFLAGGHFYPPFRSGLKGLQDEMPAGVQVVGFIGNLEFGSVLEKPQSCQLFSTQSFLRVS